MMYNNSVTDPSHRLENLKSIFISSYRKTDHHFKISLKFITIIMGDVQLYTSEMCTLSGLKT